MSWQKNSLSQSMRKNKGAVMNTKIIFLIVFAVLIIFLIWQNNAVVITKHEYFSKILPKKFDGFKVLHISDLHNKNYRGRLTDKIKEVNPDIIVITGDLIDRRKTRINTAADFVKDIVKIAPIYYVSGNHEQLSEHFNQLKTILHELNVNMMDNSYIKLAKEGSEIGLIGIADPSANLNEETYSKENNFSHMRNNINNLIRDIPTEFNILLSHRPEHFDVYSELKIDLVFCGHAHGGQIRIPFAGGLLSPNQGFFPKYSEGMHSDGTTSMVVSRGLGNSIFPFRVFNRPELVVVTLKSR